MRNFTLFAPTDKAIQQAFRSGSLNYPYLFARNKTLLEGVVAYHAVPQYQFAGPSKQTINMKTLLSEVSSGVFDLCLQLDLVLLFFWLMIAPILTHAPVALCCLVLFTEHW